AVIPIFRIGRILAPLLCRGKSFAQPFWNLPWLGTRLAPPGSPGNQAVQILPLNRIAACAAGQNITLIHLFVPSFFRADDDYPAVLPAHDLRFERDVRRWRRRIQTVPAPVAPPPRRSGQMLR